ncbi:unnamed protein product [Penicillium roqueforti FM164]|uniref:Uncharacterized protein n=1 Tax=Penicillium roqueforti (strain FM164) TaxID=1365484 RepID=W6QWL6_PENRF|nr:unnamed protein product [Penicillium roqueforti FM164]
MKMDESDRDAYDLDLDLHAVWLESSGIPTPPPCLATDPGDPRPTSSNRGEPAGCSNQRSSMIECLFHPSLDDLSGFKWTGPDPLSISTQAGDIFLHMSAFLFPKEIHWIELRLARFDGISDEILGEHLFFLPRVETVLGNLGFRLSLWPRLEPLPYSSHLKLSSLAALPPTLSLDPRFFVHNISGSYK